MSWTEPLDIYCERLGPGFWAEPINAISNLSFIVAAIFAYRLGRRLQTRTLGFYWLVTTLFAIGMGSFMFHTFANHWSMYADILPINLFQLGFIALYGAAIGRKIGLSSVLGGTILLIGFIALTKGLAQFPEDSLNGSTRYASALISLLAIGIYHAVTFSEERYTLILAAACFTLSLIFRSFDIVLCDSAPLGTHFLWHVFNGCMLYLVIKAYTGALIASHRSFKESTSEQTIT